MYQPDLFRVDDVAQMHALITPLWREHNMTVIMVTHDIKEAFGLATRLIALDRKRRPYGWRHRPIRSVRECLSDCAIHFRSENADRAAIAAHTCRDHRVFLSPGAHLSGEPSCSPCTKPSV